MATGVADVFLSSQPATAFADDLFGAVKRRVSAGVPAHSPLDLPGVAVLN
jgi:hypothetical protein